MRYIMALALLSITASAQVTTYHSRDGILKIESNYLSVDLSDTKSLDYSSSLYAARPPALIDQNLKIGVTITGTIAQAEADLANAISNQYPAIVRLKGKDRKEYAESVRTNSNNGVAALRGDLVKITEMIAEINERLERVEQK